MDNSNIVIEKLGSEYIVTIYYNDRYTRPMRIGGYYKTEKGAEKKRDEFIRLSSQPIPSIS